MPRANEPTIFSWKGKTLHQITSFLKKNENTITDKHNIFLSKPIIHYRKEIASVDLSYGNPRHNIHIDELDGAGLTIIKESFTSCNGLDNHLDINLSTNKYDTGVGTQVASNICFSQEDTAKRRVRRGGMPKKDIAIVDNTNSSRKTQYYTSSSQYLYDRNLSFSQNKNTYDKASFTPSDSACDTPVIKPNNSRFFEQGAAQSGDFITRKKYDTITENLSKYQSAFGCSVANSLAYGSNDAGYMTKEKRGYPEIKTPQFCFFGTGNTNFFDVPVITSIESGTGAAIVYFTISPSTSYSVLYMVVSKPDGVFNYGTTSPIIVTGLSNPQDYTFIVAAQVNFYTSNAIYTSESETGSTTSELLYTLLEENYYSVGKNGTAQDTTTIIYIPSLHNGRGVSEIVNHGFEDCLLLRTIYLPSSLTTIGDYAFSGCSFLQNITIPASTISIGYYAFKNCTSLSSVYVDSSNTYFSTDGYSLFSGDWLLQYCTVNQTSYSIPITTKHIDIRAFSGSNIQNVTIPSGMNEINEYAFSDCSGIINISIPASIFVLENGVFSGCTSLTKMTFEGNLIQYFSDYLFYRCNNLNDITIPISVNTLGEYIFYECSSIKRILIPNVTEIGDYAFSGCSGLTSTIFNGDRPTTIADYAFDDTTTQIYYYPVQSGWPGDSINGIAPTSLVSINGDAVVGETLTVTHKLVEAGFIDEYILITYTWYVDNVIQYGKTSSTLYVLSAYESKLIRVSISYTLNGEYRAILSGYTSRVQLIPGMSTIKTVSNGDSSLAVSFTNAANATRYMVKVYQNSIDLSMSTIGISSPITISNLTVDEYYTFTVTAMRVTSYATTYSSESSASISTVVYSSIGLTFTNTNFSFSGSQTHLYIPHNANTIPEPSDVFASITHIFVESGVTTLGQKAFNGTDYTNLQNVILPTTLTSILKYAFYDCAKLTTINIPSSVLYIEDSVFALCTSLTSLTVDETNSKYIATDSVLFTKDKSTILTYAAGKSDIAYTIPTTVTNIRTQAFASVSNIISIAIENGIATLPNSCFTGCTKLLSITLPDSITSIGSSCFEACEKLQSIVLPQYLTQITNTIFSTCKALTTIIIPDSVTSIGSGAFYNCSNITSIVIPSLVSSIGSDSFNGCSTMAKVIFQGNKPTIESPAFSGLQNGAILYYYNSKSFWTEITNIDGYELRDLDYSSNGIIYDANDSTVVTGYTITDKTHVFIPDNVTIINSNIFQDNDMITHVKFGTGILQIKDEAFLNCTSLQEVVFNGNELAIMGDRVFTGCTNLNIMYHDILNRVYSSDGLIYDDNDSSIVTGFNGSQSAVFVPDNVTTINTGAFSYNTNITHVKIGSGVSLIDSSAFIDCISLQRVIITGNALTSIGDIVFSGCIELTTINLPTSLSSVGYNIFYLCTNLKIVYIDSGNTYFKTDGYALLNYDGTEMYYYYDYTSSSYTIPESVTILRSESFLNNTSLQSVTMNSVITINSEAFKYCSNLSSITLSETLTTIHNYAFQGTSISRIIIPGYVTYIDEYIVYECSKLETVIFEGAKPSMNEYSFANTTTSIIFYYYPTESGWTGESINGVIPMNLFTINGNTVVGETLSLTHKLLEAGIIDESTELSYAWYIYE